MFSNVGTEMSRLRAEFKKFELQGIEVCKRAIRVAVIEMMSLTPVWEGTVVRNYNVSVGASSSGGVKQAIGSGPTGPTNSMRPMGDEPRRPANEAAAINDMENALGSMGNTLQDVRVSNPAPHADLVDLGSAPTPDRARNPGGVSKFGEAAAKASSGGAIR